VTKAIAAPIAALALLLAAGSAPLFLCEPRMSRV
jgi:hypothetical protein